MKRLNSIIAGLANNFEQLCAAIPWQPTQSQVRRARRQLVDLNIQLQDLVMQAKKDVEQLRKHRVELRRQVNNLQLQHIGEELDRTERQKVQK